MIITEQKRLSILTIRILTPIQEVDGDWVAGLKVFVFAAVVLFGWFIYETHLVLPINMPANHFFIIYLDE